MAMPSPKFKIDISRCIFFPEQFLCSCHHVDIEIRKKSYCISCKPLLERIIKKEYLIEKTN